MLSLSCFYKKKRVGLGSLLTNVHQLESLCTCITPPSKYSNYVLLGAGKGKTSLVYTALRKWEQNESRRFTSNFFPETKTCPGAFHLLLLSGSHAVNLIYRQQSKNGPAKSFFLFFPPFSLSTQSNDKSSRRPVGLRAESNQIPSRLSDGSIHNSLIHDGERRQIKGSKNQSVMGVPYNLKPINIFLL